MITTTLVTIIITIIALKLVVIMTVVLLSASVISLVGMTIKKGVVLVTKKKVDQCKKVNLTTHL